MSNLSVHIDVESEVRKEEAKPGSGPDKFIASEETVRKHMEAMGPTQVESLLRLDLDSWTEKKLEDAADDADAIYHLQKSRIIK